MRRLAFIIALLASLTVTAAASADVPSPAVAACQAEYKALGADAFVAKYGPTEPWGHCYAQHTETTTAPDSPAATACKAEYVQLGADAFAAKYGSPETFGSCVKAHTTTTPAPPKPPREDGAATSVATALCQALARTLGKSVFLGKYGPKEAMGNCVRMSLASARSLVASCKATSAASKDAFRACLAAGLQPRR